MNEQIETKEALVIRLNLLFSRNQIIWIKGKTVFAFLGGIREAVVRSTEGRWISAWLETKSHLKKYDGIIWMENVKPL